MSKFASSAVLFMAILLVAASPSQTCQNCGLRSVQATVTPSFQGADATQIRASIDYVHRDFVVSFRTTQTWDRILVTGFRAIDGIPYVGALGMGRAFEDKQTALLDEELAQWASYGLEKERERGGLQRASVSEITNAILDRNGPFATEPEAVREAVRDFLLKIDARNAVDLRNKLDELRNHQDVTRKLTGQQVARLQKQLKDLRSKIDDLDSKLVESLKKGEKPESERVQKLLGDVRMNAEALGTIFPKDKMLVAMTSQVSKAMQFAQLAMLATAQPAGAVYILPAIASGLSFIRGFDGGASENPQQALMEMIRDLEELIKRNHLELMFALERNYGQILRNTALLKASLFTELDQCLDVLDHRIAKANYTPDGFYNVNLGPAFKSIAEFKTNFSRISQKLKGCQSGLSGRFTGAHRLQPFVYDPKDDVPLNLPQDQRGPTNQYINEALLPTVGDLGQCVGVRTFVGLRSPASRTVDELRKKIEQLATVDVSKETASKELVTPLNPGDAARTVGLLVALHNTFELAPAGRFTGELGDINDGYTTVKAGVYLARVAALQQRMMTGDVLLPLLVKILRVPSLARSEDRAIFGKWVKDGSLADFPLTNSPKDAKKYADIRNTIILAMSSNPILRTNMLIWELNDDLRTDERRRAVAAALKSGAEPLLPSSWAQGWRLQWSPKRPAGETSWRYTFDYAKRNKQGHIDVLGRGEDNLPKSRT